MNYLELSIENVKEENEKLYKNIKDNYSYDLVIFIAKGAFLIGAGLADLKKVSLIEIEAKRNGGKIKKVIKPFMKLFPKKLLIFVREREMKSDYHEKRNDRKISFNENIYRNYKNCKKILLVDDSIDSGNSIIETRKVLENYFEESEIKVAVFNIMNKAVIRPDFYLYEDTMIQGPWSSDSKYNNEFNEMYMVWKDEYLAYGKTK